MGDEATFLVLMDSGLAQCRAAVDGHGSLLVSLFMAGLVGSASHCVGMCGPFVLAQTVFRLETRPAGGMSEFHRLSGALVLPYHLGRTTTYAVLGALGGTLAGGLSRLPGLRGLGAALLVLAALFFLGYGLRRLGVTIPWLDRGGEGWWSRHLGRRVRPLFERPVGWRGYGLGMALGMLPCGLLYGALGAASATTDPLAAALGMGAFSLGTFPALLAVGLAGHVAGSQWRSSAARVAPVLLVINAMALSYLAWRMMI